MSLLAQVLYLIFSVFLPVHHPRHWSDWIVSSQTTSSRRGANRGPTLLLSVIALRVEFIALKGKKRKDGENETSAVRVKEERRVRGLSTHFRANCLRSASSFCSAGRDVARHLICHPSDRVSTFCSEGRCRLDLLPASILPFLL